MRGAVGLVSSLQSDKTQRVSPNPGESIQKCQFDGKKTLANGVKSMEKCPWWDGCAAAM